jgi:hypothetical protein
MIELHSPLSGLEERKYCLCQYVARRQSYLGGTSLKQIRTHASFFLFGSQRLLLYWLRLEPPLPHAALPSHRRCVFQFFKIIDIFILSGHGMNS